MMFRVLSSAFTMACWKFCNGLSLSDRCGRGEGDDCEVKVLTPAVVSLVADAFEPAGAVMPPMVRAGSPASSTCVPCPATPGGGITMLPGPEEPASDIVSVACDNDPSPSLIV